jgi:hypothetical protein
MGAKSGVVFTSYAPMESTPDIAKSCKCGEIRRFKRFQAPLRVKRQATCPLEFDHVIEHCFNPAVIGDWRFFWLLAFHGVSKKLQN